MMITPFPKKKKSTKLSGISLLLDLDGSVSDSLPHNYRATVRAARYFGLRKPELEEIRKHFDPSGGFGEFHKKIGVPDKLKLMEPGSDRTVYGTKWMEFYSEELKSNPPELSPGAAKLIQRLYSLGISQYIFSLATRDHIESQLGELQKYFEDLISVKENKMTALTNMEEKMKNKKIVHVGDTVYDGRCAVSVGVVFGAILHECAYNTEEALKKFVELNSRMAFTIDGFENFETDLSNMMLNRT